MLKAFRILLFVALGLAVALVVFVAVAEIGQARREAAGEEAPAGERMAAGDAEIFVRRFGAPDAPAVVIVPGTAAWSGFWMSAAQAIAQSGFRVVAVDLPPFGFSSRPDRGGYTRAEQAERLATLLDSLKLEKPIVLAHSFGAGAAVELALRHPGRLGGLVLVDGALALVPEGGEPPADPAWLKAALASKPIAGAVVDSVLINPWLTRRLLAGLLARPEAATDALVAPLQRPYRRAGTSLAYARWLPSLLFRDPTALSADPAAYRKLTLPVALLWGADDHVTPIAQGERLRALIPGATLDAIGGVGHIPHIEDEAAFVSATVRRLTAMAKAP